MKISRDDAQLFFELFLPLLDFTNKRFNVFLKLSILLDTIWTNDFRKPRIPCYSKDFS